MINKDFYPMQRGWKMICTDWLAHIPSIHTIVDEGDVKKMLDTQQIKEIIFISRRPFSFFDFRNSVYQKKRIAMGNNFFNLLSIQFTARLKKKLIHNILPNVQIG
jgi:hypothetical protein